MFVFYSYIKLYILSNGVCYATTIDEIESLIGFEFFRIECGEAKEFGEQEAGVGLD